MDDKYYILTESNEVSDAFSIEQIATANLTPNRLVNKNNTGWKAASDFPELREYFIPEKPLPPVQSVLSKPLPPTFQENIQQPKSGPSQSSENPTALNFYNNLNQKQKQLIKYGGIGLLAILGFFYYQNSNCEAELKEKERNLNRLNTELSEKQGQLRELERDSRNANAHLEDVQGFRVGRTREQREREISSARSAVTTCSQRRNECRSDIEEIRVQIAQLNDAIEELHEKCGNN